VEKNEYLTKNVFEMLLESLMLFEKQLDKELTTI
jgi:hypothetical protein